MLGAMLSRAAPLQVSALHPLMADLARQVGGERVAVADLAGGGGNLHRFEPRPADMQRMQSSALVLVAGKKLEPYLDRLRSALNGVMIVEVGSTIPSLMVAQAGACDYLSVTMNMQGPQRGAGLWTAVKAPAPHRFGWARGFHANANPRRTGL